MALLNVLLIGDVIGKPGRRALRELLPAFCEQQKIDFIIANGENAAGGLGITGPTAREIFKEGIDVITLGNHTYRHSEVNKFLAKESRIIRPANYSDAAPGRGVTIVEKNGYAYAVVNLQGTIFMDKEVQNPFQIVDELLPSLHKETSLVFVDFHAEATSEKVAMGYFLDGKVTAVFGTHTHVQTADAKILPKGTAYITDLGMTGPDESVIGVAIKGAVTRFATGQKARFEPAKGSFRMDLCLVCVDGDSGRAKSIRIFQLHPGKNPKN